MKRQLAQGDREAEALESYRVGLTPFNFELIRLDPWGAVQISRRSPSSRPAPACLGAPGQACTLQVRLSVLHGNAQSMTYPWALRRLALQDKQDPDYRP